MATITLTRTLVVRQGVPFDVPDDMTRTISRGNASAPRREACATTMLGQRSRARAIRAATTTPSSMPEPS